MNNYKIEVRIIEDEEGYFIAKAVDYRGVIAFGRSEEEVMDRIAWAWFSIYQAQTKTTMRRHTTHNPVSPGVNERNLELQFAY